MYCNTITPTGTLSPFSRYNTHVLPSNPLRRNGSREDGLTFSWRKIGRRAAIVEKIYNTFCDTQLYPIIF
jgi:hypothetical protein